MGPNILVKRNNLFDQEIGVFEKSQPEEIDGYEIPVYMTKDQYCVVALGDQINTAPIYQLSLQELLDNEEEVHLLSDILDVSQEFNKLILILKEGPDYPYLEKKVIKIVNQMGLEQKVILTSFRYHIVEKLNKINHDIEVALGFTAGLYQPWEQASNLGADAIYAFYAAVVPLLVNKSHKAGLKVIVYGANESQMIDKLIRLGVDTIITNNLDKAFQIREKYRNEGK